MKYKKYVEVGEILSKEFRDFITKTLDPNVETRPTINAIAQHAWFNN